MGESRMQLGRICTAVLLAASVLPPLAAEARYDRQKRVWTDPPLPRNFAPSVSGRKERRFQLDGPRLEAPGPLIYTEKLTGTVKITVVVWGEDPFFQNYEEPRDYTYTWESAAATLPGSASDFFSTLVMPASLTPASSISASSTAAYSVEDFFYNFLPQQFLYATRGLLRLKVKVVLQKAYSTEHDYNSEDFLSLSMFNGLDCSTYDPALQENCIRNTTATYREILARKSRKRFWYFEMAGGDANSSSMLDEVRDHARTSAGWSGLNDSTLLVIGGPQVDALGFHLYASQTSYIPAPREQRTLLYDFPYKTMYYSKYGLAEEIIHEIGHSMGLGHDCEDAAGNALSESDCDFIESIMAHQRKRPDNAPYERTINRFSSCDIQYLKTKYLTSPYFGGPVSDGISDYDCDRR